MKRIFFSIIVITLFSCKEKNKVIEGDIYIKLINTHSLYGLPKEKTKKFKNEITNPDQTNYSESEKKLNKYFKILIDHDLFNKPHFKLLTTEGRIINVYTNEKEYLKLKEELTDFNKEKEKIALKFKGDKIPNNIIDSDSIFNQEIYCAKNIISVQKMKGQTNWAK